MWFIIFFTVTITIITFVSLKIWWDEIVIPFWISSLVGLISIAFGCLILLVVVNVGMNNVLASETFQVLPINNEEQIVYYINQGDSTYVLITNEDGKLVDHKTSYKYLHFIKENETAYAIRNQMGFKSEFWNRIFKIGTPYYVYQYYIPVT